MISTEEAERRRAHVRIAAADTRIEGLKVSVGAQEIVDAYIRGDIEACHLVAAFMRRSS